MSNSIDKNPLVYIIPFQNLEGEKIAQGILSNGDVPPDEVYPMKKYNWTIANKYYTAAVQLCIVDDLTPFSMESSGSVESLIVYFDFFKDCALNDVKSRMDQFEDIEADVQILVCDNCTESGFETSKAKKDVLSWCIENSWELVELNGGCSEESDNEFEDALPDTYGFERIRQALHAHTWSNLELKSEDKSNHLGNILKSLTLNEPSENSYENFENSSSSDLSSSDEDEDEMDGEDNFSHIFSQLGEMKSVARGLSETERKNYAEKMALAFYKSIGGDDEDSDGPDN